MTNTPLPPAIARSRIRVLVVDDSAVTRALLTHILNSDPDLEVVGSVANGSEAIKAAALFKPDLITMDIHMPGLNGFETTRAIMETHPVPIVIVTGSSDMMELEVSFQAIEAGALTVLEKPEGVGHADHERNAGSLISTVKLMSEVKVVRRWKRPDQKQIRSERTVACEFPLRPVKVDVVAIGASTGGPPVIERILAELPKDFRPAVMIVQHMTDGFIPGFVEWLGQTSTLPVHVAFHGIIARPGHVYVAPGGLQMKLDTAGRICCVEDGPMNCLCPSVSYLFGSIAEIYGKRAVGVLLTGMGKDGAMELKMMRDKGAVTIAQDRQTSAVFGMPGEAARLEAARYILPARRIAGVLAGLATTKRSGT